MKTFLFLCVMGFTVSVHAQKQEHRDGLEVAVQSYFLALAAAEDDEGKIKALDYLGAAPDVIDSNLATGVLCTFLKDSSEKVRFTAAKTAYATIPFIAIWTDDLSNIRSLLEKMSTNELILQEKPVAIDLRAPPQKVAVLAAGGLVGIYRRTTSNENYKRYSLRLISVARKLADRAELENNFSVLHLLSFCDPSVKPTETLSIAADAFERQPKQLAIIMVTSGIVTKVLKNNIITKNSKKQLLRIADEARTLLTDPDDNVREYAEEMIANIKARTKW